MSDFHADIAAINTSTLETRHVRSEFANSEDAVAASLEILRALRRELGALVWLESQARIPEHVQSLGEADGVIWWCRFRVGDDVKGVCVVRRAGEEDVGVVDGSVAVERALGFGEGGDV